MSRRNGDHNPQEEVAPEELGVIVRGSLSEGLEMRLAEEKSVEDLRAGKFLVVQGERSRFFALLSDVQLSTTHPNILLHPPRREDILTRAVLTGTSTFGTIKLRPMLMVPHDADPDDEESLQPVKTIPAHFSPVYEATREDVGRVFGDERRDPRFFYVGLPLDMDTPVCLNLDRWVERSNAIFGKSGTGKTFLTRLCLCGVIKADKAVNLIFDMHSEYGWQGTTEQRDREAVRGLKQYFRTGVQIFTLDPQSSRRRKVQADFEVRIPYSQITVEDILLLQRELNLNATAVETCYLLMREFKEQWLKRFLAMGVEEIKEFVGENNAHQGALSALQRKLNVLVEDCKEFLCESVPDGDDAVQHILDTLQGGHNVVLEFGRHDRPVQYMLVANILTRRLHHIYVEMTEKALGDSSQKPRPLVITIEEAHKFLSSHLAGQTIFGTIAREMRKYNMTLLIVDQRPSGIDDEVLSQVGTKICCLLDDEKDMDAVLTGMSGANSLRGVLASLETRQQALIFGHAVPMPVVVRTRQYDDAAFREAICGPDGAAELAGTPEARAALHARLLRDRDLDFA
jgi:DNA helicase HerA-like ATPase